MSIVIGPQGRKVELRTPKGEVIKTGTVENWPQALAWGNAQWEELYRKLGPEELRRLGWGKLELRFYP